MSIYRMQMIKTTIEFHSWIPFVLFLTTYRYKRNQLVKCIQTCNWLVWNKLRVACLWKLNNPITKQSILGKNTYQQNSIAAASNVVWGLQRIFYAQHAGSMAIHHTFSHLFLESQLINVKNYRSLQAVLTLLMYIPPSRIRIPVWIKLNFRP